MSGDMSDSGGARYPSREWVAALGGTIVCGDAPAGERLSMEAA